MGENLPTLETLDTSPFKKLVLSFGAVPTDFKESMTYYELLAWLCNVIEKQIIPVVNQHSEKFNELINAYNQLKDYVDNYFKNLDVQEEINNKLDDMAESGELESIIAAYLNTNAVLGFNSIADLQEATNLVNGCFVETFGKEELNDGLHNLYKISSESLTPDGDNIIELQNNLVAIKIRPPVSPNLKDNTNNILNEGV